MLEELMSYKATGIHVGLWTGQIRLCGGVTSMRVVNAQVTILAVGRASCIHAFSNGSHCGHEKFNTADH